jgi:hypothetical protein
MPAARLTGKARTSQLLVVDASIVAAAGGEEATDPVPAHARDALMAILTICHRVCLSPELSQEWKRHQSRFARAWLTRMYARGKVVRRESPARSEILADIRSFHLITQSDIAAVEKDIHLINAALAADQAVLSWDNRMAATIRKVCADAKTVTSSAVSHVLWINPITDRDALHAWLSETGPAQPYWQLGAPALPDPIGRRAGSRSTQRGKP